MTKKEAIVWFKSPLGHEPGGCICIMLIRSCGMTQQVELFNIQSPLKNNQGRGNSFGFSYHWGFKQTAAMWRIQSLFLNKPGGLI